MNPFFEKIIENIRIGLKKRTENFPGASRPSPVYGDLDEFLFFTNEDEANPLGIKKERVEILTQEIGEDIWKIAERNTCKSILIKTPQKIKEEFLSKNLHYNKLYKLDTESMPLYCVTSKSLLYGAGVVYDKNYLKTKLETVHGKMIKSIVIIPSSLHDVIIYIDNKESIPLQAFSNLVTDINKHILQHWDRLSDHAYRISY